jgi:hypothetical protein
VPPVRRVRRPALQAAPGQWPGPLPGTIRPLDWSCTGSAPQGGAGRRGARSGPLRSPRSGPARGPPAGGWTRMSHRKCARRYEQAAMNVPRNAKLDPDIGAAHDAGPSPAAACYANITSGLSSSRHAPRANFRWSKVMSCSHAPLLARCSASAKSRPRRCRSSAWRRPWQNAGIRCCRAVVQHPLTKQATLGLAARRGAARHGTARHGTARHGGARPHRYSGH